MPHTKFRENRSTGSRFLAYMGVVILTQMPTNKLTFPLPMQALISLLVLEMFEQCGRRRTDDRRMMGGRQSMGIQ